jgi:hypothetical protein
MKKRCQIILLGMIMLTVAACDRPEPIAPAKKSAKQIATLHYHALVIGIGDYSGTGWPTLGTARADAEAVSEVLRSQYGFEVTELTDRHATHGNILRALDQIMNLGKDDALLIFFAGHGFYDEAMSEGYWIPFGAQRSRMNRPAKEDWLWNSSIDRILSASPARHILLVADTCYGGSLFRGEETPEKSLYWYQRAMSVPSRGLITSGNLEPVLDSGIHHSVFAQELLNYLQYSEQDVFSASDIAVSIRSKVSQLTGQLVRMGPLASQAHAGGEFVFVRPGTEFAITSNGSNSPVFRNAPPVDSLQLLANRIQKSGFVRPRVLACLGPEGNEPETMRIRSRLHDCLNMIGGSILVEREAFDSLLQEVELSSSGMADHRAATEIGRLLPASLILFGEVIPDGEQKEIHLRVVDTETSRVLCSTAERFSSREEMNQACQVLAQRIMTSVDRARPILLPAQETGTNALEAGWGRFHGARVGDSFDIVSREAFDTVSPKETVLGKARLQSLGEERALFQADWTTAATNRPAMLWLKATL